MLDRLKTAFRLGVALAVFGARTVLAAPVHEIVYGFSPSPRAPVAGVVAGPDGKLYGTSQFGGTKDLGTVFRLDQSGNIEVNAHFAGNNGIPLGAEPTGRLALGSDGNFYGTTKVGGPNAAGTLFRMTPDGSLTTLVQFGWFSVPLGSQPTGELIEGPDGNFYGTTSVGGAGNRGTIFKVTKAGILTTLGVFTGSTGAVKGANPLAGLTLGNDGSFYGSTSSGGAGNFGTIFKITPAGSFTSLVEFTGTSGAARGNRPAARLLRDAVGNFLGTTENGGTGNAGTIFKITPAGVFTSLVEFTQTNVVPKGKSPRSGLISGFDGNFYGCTVAGGASDYGTIFKLSPAGVFSTVIEFSGDTGTATGSEPGGDLLLHSDGNIYGTTKQGGPGSNGTVFKLSPSGQLSTMVVGHPIGPAGGVLHGPDGTLYFAMSSGGSSAFGYGNDGVGAIMKLIPGNAPTTLVSFTGFDGTAPGAYPAGQLALESDGSLFGTTKFGGRLGDGTVFKITPSGALTSLVQFNAFSGPFFGQRPLSGLFKSPDGNFYGTTSSGGINGRGTIFKLTPAGGFSNIVHFTNNTGNAKGADCEAQVIETSDGLLYGTTSGGGASGFGTVFKVTKAGALTTLVEFGVGTNNGRSPVAAVTQGIDGSFYGTTQAGGIWGSGYGTLFKVTSGGVFTNIADFSSDAPPTFGTRPVSGLFRAPDGNLYGATVGLGQPSDFGTIYRLTPAGVLTNIVLFTGDGTQANAGSGPNMPLFTMGPDGNLYGTTGAGGPRGYGTIFRLRFGPTPTTMPATALTGISAQLNATVNPNGAATTVGFEWGTSPSALANTTSAITAGSGSVAVTRSRSLSGLLPGTTYYFRVKAENGEQFAPQFGTVRSFTTNTPPAGGTVTVAPASPVGPGVMLTASASGWVDPNTPLMYQFFLDGASLGPAGVAAVLNFTAPIILGDHTMTVRVLDALGDYAEASQIFTVNSVPTARVATLGNISGSAASIAVAKLLTYASDADGDAIALIAVNPASTHGGTVSLAAGIITYTPPPDYTGEDSFTYTLRDSRGATAVGTVNVQVTAANAPSFNIVSMTSTTEGFLLKFAGIPGVPYLIQFRNTFGDPWQTLIPPGPVNAGPNGLFEFEDKPNPRPASRFYRAAQPQ